jgi:hypothetical protein
VNNDQWVDGLERVMALVEKYGDLGPRYEYETRRRRDDPWVDEFLNEKAREGWRLVAVTRDESSLDPLTFFFERRVQ